MISTNQADRLLKLAAQLIRLGLVAWLLAFLVANFSKFGVLASRLTQVSVEGVFTLHVEPLPSVPGAATSEAGYWATLHRSEPRVDISAINFKKNEPEFIEVEARERLQLTGGFIGDSKKLLSLGNTRFVLEPKQCVRLYTFAPTKKLEPGNGCLKPVVASRTNGEAPEKGMFKGDPGEGDRIVIFDRYRKPVLDMDFWVVPANPGL